MITKIKEGFFDQRLIRLPVEVITRSQNIPFLRDLFVTDIGSFPHAPNHYVEQPQGYPHHKIIYNTSGTGWCCIEGKHYATSPKQAFIIPAKAAHSYGANEQTPWSVYWVHFNGKRSHDLIKAINPTQKKDPRIFVPRSNAITNAFEDCYRWTTKGLSDSSLIAMAGSFSRLASLFIIHQRSKNTKTQRAEERILKSIQWMQQNLKETIALEELASQASLSAPHYSSLFKKQCGAPPIRFLIRLRMQRACELLDNNNHIPINEISQSVGYEDPFHFSRMFKEVVGATPSAYRKSGQQFR